MIHTAIYFWESEVIAAVMLSGILSAQAIYCWRNAAG